MERQVLLVDTYSLFFRAYHALPEMNTASGEPTSAVYGFCAALLKELKDYAPAQLAFAVDAPQKTFRHERFASYKGTRDATPSPLVAQFGRLRQLLAAFGVPVYQVPGVEADDVLATLAARLASVDGAGPAGAGHRVLVLSGDRDLLQVARAEVRILFLGARGQKPSIYDIARVHERFLVRPEQLPMWAALVGDASDNLPGVPGVGPRTASKWVQEFGTIRELLARMSQVRPARLQAPLLAHSEQLLLNEELATLRADVPLGDGPWAAPLGHDAFDRLRALFTELEFKSLRARLDELERASLSA